MKRKGKKKGEVTNKKVERKEYLFYHSKQKMLQSMINQVKSFLSSFWQQNKTDYLNHWKSSNKNQIIYQDMGEGMVVGDKRKMLFQKFVGNSSEVNTSRNKDYRFTNKHTTVIPSS